jgi:DNA polymerase
MQPAFKSSHSDKDTPSARPKVDYDIPADMNTWNGLVLVGEAPGAEEVRLGHPFVGRSGQLLDKMLEKAGIVRRQCVVANVFRDQPPGNKVDHFFISRRAASAQNIAVDEKYGSFSGKLCRAEFASEIEHLRKTLERLQKNGSKIILVALGRTPLWALTGENELLKKVGRILPCHLLPDVKVMPTFHPSFILRGNWKLQDEWLEHFLAAKANSMNVIRPSAT